MGNFKFKVEIDVDVAAPDAGEWWIEVGRLLRSLAHDVEKYHGQYIGEHMPMYSRDESEMPGRAWVE